MATVSSLGIGSGLDLNTLLSQLVAAERAAPEARIQRAETKLTTEVSALATLKGALASLQSAAKALKGETTLDLRKVTVGDDAYFSASAGATAAAGSYSVQVQKLAQAAQLGSKSYAGADAEVGTGTLTISVGDTSFDVQVGDDDKTLAGVRDAINAAAGSSGVQATLVNGVDVNGDPEAHLVLTSTKTGLANAISVAVADDDGADPDDGSGLSELATGKLSVISAAQDAVAIVSGYTVSSSTNTLTDAIDGVTLTLKKVTTPAEGATPAQTVSLNVARDDAAIQKKIESFVAAFNNMASQVKALSAYDATTKTGGPLLGDAMLRGIDSQIRRMIGDPVASGKGYNSLSSMGITTTVTGTLQLDASKFKAAMEADPTAVERIFSAENGVASRIGGFLDARLSSSGELASREAGNTRLKLDLSKQREALDARMTVVEERYVKQFSALDSMLSQLQSTSSYLTSQLSSLSNLNSSK